MKRMYLFRGFSGSGKSELAERLVGQENVYAADQMPGLYVDGVYQANQQRAAHEWCKRKVKKALMSGEDVAVANTNIKLGYMQPYIEMAKDFGYSVQVITCEGVTLADGSQPKNVHNTPKAVIASQINGFQLFNRPAPGITVTETVAGLQALSMASEHQIICDLNNTLIKPKSGSFINQAEDAEPKRDVMRSLSERGVKSIAIASNQLGVGAGHIERSELEKLAVITLGWLKEYDICCDTMLFATHRNSRKALLWQSGYLAELELDLKADKPNFGMIRHLLKSENVICIGDAHMQGRSEGIDMVRSAQSEFRITYVPVEALI